MTNDDDTRPARRRDDPAAQTVELDAKVLRKLVVSTILDLGEESGSVPVRVVPPPQVDHDAEPEAPAADDVKRV